MTAEESKSLAVLANEVKNLVGAVTDLKRTVEGIRSDCPDHKAAITEHAARITELEKQCDTLFNRMWQGAAGMVVLFITTVVGFVAWAVQHIPKEGKP